VIGVSVPTGVLSTVLAVAGLLVIAFGAGVYTIATRFRAEGMGKSQEDADEGSDNG
jgi:O-antigen/teichoic acid export membrane protein